MGLELLMISESQLLLSKLKQPSETCRIVQSSQVEAAFILYGPHCSQQNAVCTSPRIDSSVTPIVFRGGWGWGLTSGQFSMRLFASSVEEFGLFAIQKLGRDRGEAPLVSLACYCEQREHCWCTPNMHLMCFCKQVRPSLQ